MVSLGMHSLKDTFQIQLMGDHAIQFKTTATICDGLDQDLLALSAFLKARELLGIKDMILAYDTLTLIYDVLIFVADPYVFASQLLAAFKADTSDNIAPNYAAKLIEVPVCYDPSLGIDLEHAAIIANCSVEALIQKHTNKMYTVYCLGFLPGFAYMGNVAEAIQLPRHATPRAKVLAGSVGIAGKQTGIYPIDSPGGWQIIGRTPIQIFDAKNATVSLFKVGDQVQFNPISLELFHQLNHQEDVH